MYSKIEPKRNISNIILCCCKSKPFHLKKKPRDTFKFGSKFLYHQALKQWFSTFSVPWPIFQPKLTSQPTLVNKIKFPSQNHSVF